MPFLNMSGATELFRARMGKRGDLSFVTSSANRVLSDGELEVAFSPIEGSRFTGEALRVCGNKECVNPRILPWRSRRRPIFEGLWACSQRCMSAMIRAAIRRECGQPDAFENEFAHRHRIPLGLVLLAQGWITHPQLQHALATQRASGGRIGDWLVTQCGIEREQVTRGLSVQWRCPVLTTAGFAAREMALVMPKAFIDEFGAVPLRTANSEILYLAFEDKLDASLALALQKMSGLKIVSGFLGSEDFRGARGSLLAANEVKTTLESISDIDEIGRAHV